MIDENTINASIIIPTLGRLETIVELSKHLLILKPNPIEILIIFQDKVEYEQFLGINTSSFIKPILISKKSAVSARNEGIRFAKGKFLVFLDDDCKPIKSTWLRQITAPLHNPGISISTGSVFGWEKASGKSNFINRAFLLLPIILEPFGNPESHKSDYCHTFAGGNFAARKSELESIGGFNENFESPSLYEEIELSFKIKKKTGKVIWYESSASVYHDQVKSGGMRQANMQFSEEFVIAQRKKLFNEVFNGRLNICLRLTIYQIFRLIVKLSKKLRLLSRNNNEY
jgi:glycosyltransferase involved in cell wall biosynthesis